ncbi:MAG: hypothetical protein V1492_01170 [Candidatus Micrarchaeota archaeon]
MYLEIPQQCMRAFALFFAKYSTNRPFTQSELDWVVSQSMKKKIFSILLRANWIRKKSKAEYLCNEPDEIFSHLLEFRVPEMMKKAKMPYCFTGLSAIEIWSDYSYVQRDMKRSPYFIRVLKKDLRSWKAFFSASSVPVYVGKGTNIGEFVILLPAARIRSEEKDGLRVEHLADAMAEARQNDLYRYAYNYMRDKYGKTSAA